MSTFDRDKARQILIDSWDDGNATGLDGWEGAGIGARGEDPEASRRIARFLEPALDRLEECVRPDPPQGIDRDALIDLLHSYIALRYVEKCADEVLALVRPVEGIVLTPEERRQLAYLVEHAAHSSTLDIWVIDWFEAHGAELAARLEAG